MTLHRVGYGGLKLNEFLAELNKLSPDLVVDTRFNPRSRNPDYSESRLKTAIRMSGLEYMYWYGLGNRNYKNGGPISIVDPDDVGKVHKMAETHKIVLICVCPTAAKTCHNQLIMSDGPWRELRLF